MMTLSSSVIGCLFYIFLIGYHFDTTNGSNPTHTTTHTGIETSLTTESTTPDKTETHKSTFKSSVHMTTPLSDSTSITLANDTDIKSNSTATTSISKSLPLILGLIFGGLGVIILITSIVIYVLIQQGYIKVFNSPRTRMKDTDRSRLGDSSSSIGAASPSRR